MKIAVTYRPKTPPPAEAMPELFQGVAEWMKKYGDRFEAFYFFAGGGGFSVGDFDDSAEVQRLMAEHPFTMYSDVEMHAVVDPDTALKQLKEAFG